MSCDDPPNTIRSSRKKSSEELRRAVVVASCNTDDMSARTLTPWQMKAGKLLPRSVLYSGDVVHNVTKLGWQVDDLRDAFDLAGDGRPEVTRIKISCVDRRASLI